MHTHANILEGYDHTGSLQAFGSVGDTQVHYKEACGKIGSFYVLAFVQRSGNWVQDCGLPMIYFQNSDQNTPGRQLPSFQDLT